MKAVGLLFFLAAFLIWGAPVLHFQITDGRGKETTAIIIDAGAANEDGWRSLTVIKAKGDAVIVWPFDQSAKTPDGPEPIPAIVILRGEEKALDNRHIVAAMATPVVLGLASVEEESRRTGFASEMLTKSFSDLAMSADPFEKGLGLLYGAKAADAAEQFSVALRQRQRQLTRVPSEIYPVAILDGLALYRANKFDDAAVAFLSALKQRPSDQWALKYRSDALVKAGKATAAGR